MILLHRIVREQKDRVNSNFNSIGEIISQDEDLSFDGVYTCFREHAEQIAYWKEKTKKRVILFPCGAHAGSSNHFDVGQPYGEFLHLHEVYEIGVKYGFEVGWHSMTHRNLLHIPASELYDELLPPVRVQNPNGSGMVYFGAKVFAYPYGDVSTELAQLVERAGYEEAYSVSQGDGSQFQKKRRYLNW